MFIYESTQVVKIVIGLSLMTVTELLEADLISHCGQLKKLDKIHWTTVFRLWSQREENHISRALGFLTLGILKTMAWGGPNQAEPRGRDPEVQGAGGCWTLWSRVLREWRDPKNELHASSLGSSRVFGWLPSCLWIGWDYEMPRKKPLLRKELKN